MDERSVDMDPKAERERTPLQIFRIFLVLGLTSFGGPIAHLGYFREAFVVRRRWLDERAYAGLVALCQILPGPASSQVGFAIGLREAGLMGGFAAFAGFTLPSALLMFAAAGGIGLLPGDVRGPLFHGLVLVAAPVVAHAVFGMAHRLCNRIESAIIAAVTLVLLLTFDQPWLQPLAIALGGVTGILLLPAATPIQQIESSSTKAGRGITCLVLFAALLGGLPMLAHLAPIPVVQLADGFYRSGALVFGGGHVILPLLESETVARGWIEPGPFLAGYGAAQALPGPLTAFAAYLGAAATTGLQPALGALVAVVAIFAPGLLLVAGVLPFWNTLSERRWMAGLAAGAGAAVVGVLAAALWRPIITSAILSSTDALIASAGLALLFARTPVWIVVATVAAAGAYSSAG